MGGCLHREHQLKSSATTSSPGERGEPGRWLPKVVLPYGLPAGNFPLLYHSHDHSTASKSQ